MNKIDKAYLVFIRPQKQSEFDLMGINKFFITASYSKEEANEIIKELGDKGHIAYYEEVFSNSAFMF